MPYRNNEVIVMTGPDKHGATRMREAWRSFWRYRGEEVSAFWSWLPDVFKFGVSFAAVVLAIVSFMVYIMIKYDQGQVQFCEEKCDLVSAEAAVYDHGCYCIVDGKPKLWKYIE